MTNDRSNNWSLPRILVWLTASISAALIGAIIKDYWEAAHPTVDIHAVSITSPPTPIDIHAKLLRDIRNHPYLSIDATDEFYDNDIAELIKDFEIKDEERLEAVATITRLIDYLKATSADLSLKMRQRDFLTILTAGGLGSMLEDWAKITLKGYEEKLPDRYQRHPEGSEGLYVSIPIGIYNLAEIDEEEFARQESQARGPVNVYARVLLDARRTNLFRRLLLYQEADVLLPFLDALKLELNGAIQSSRDISQRLQKYISTSLRHLGATAMVTNTGHRPFSIGLQGVLFLHFPARVRGGKDGIMAADLDVVEDKPILVPGGEARLLKFITRDNLHQIVEETGNVDVDGLRSLFAEGGIRARISIARAGVGEADLVIGPSDIRPIGPKSIDNAFNIIRNSDKLYR